MKLSRVLFVAGMVLAITMSGCARNRCCTGRPAILGSAPIAAPAPCPSCPQGPVIPGGGTVAPPPGSAGGLPPIPAAPGQV